jgi:hypothetical protein
MAMYKDDEQGQGQLLQRGRTERVGELGGAMGVVGIAYWV